MPFLYSCEALKYKPTKAGEVPVDPKDRVRKNIEEGRGFRLMGGVNKGGDFDFASSNYLWRATLDTINFMPLVSANYSGGIVITDWYAENNIEDEAIKISVRFLSNEIRADALDIKVFNRKCNSMSNCIIKEINDELGPELKKQILKKATLYKQEAKNKDKKNK